MLSLNKYCKYFFIIIFFLLFISCKKESKSLDVQSKEYLLSDLRINEIDDKKFTINCIIKDSDNVATTINYIEHICQTIPGSPSLRIENIYRHLNIENKNEYHFGYFKNEILIEYPSDNQRMGNIIVYRRYYDIFTEKGSFKAFYIKWNRFSNKIPKLLKKNEFYEKIITPLWKINKFTDTIFTNLDKNTIIKLFPEFVGTIIKISFSKIIIDYDKYDPKITYGYDQNFPSYNYPIRRFYDNIEFIK